MSNMAFMPGKGSFPDETLHSAAAGINSLFHALFNLALSQWGIGRPTKMPVTSLVL